MDDTEHQIDLEELIAAAKAKDDEPQEEAQQGDEPGGVAITSITLSREAQEALERLGADAQEVFDKVNEAARQC